MLAVIWDAVSHMLSVVSYFFENSFFFLSDLVTPTILFFFLMFFVSLLFGVFKR